MGFRIKDCKGLGFECKPLGLRKAALHSEASHICLNFSGSVVQAECFDLRFSLEG